MKYKTFESLLADVMGDFKSYSNDNLIEPQELIRVAKWCTSDLGLRVYRTKEELLELNHNKAKLPDDFYSFNYGLLCGEGMIRFPRPQGIHVVQVPYPSFEEVPSVVDPCTTTCETHTCGTCGICAECTTGLVVVPGYNPLQPIGDACIKPRVFMDCKGDSFELVQILQTETRRWKYMLPLRLISSDQDIFCDCPNVHATCPDQIWIKDGFLHSNMECGKIYLNFEGSLEDEKGDLLVPDHDKITPYYEYKLKVRILENLYVNGEDVERKLSYFKLELRSARIEAWTTVRMPNFRELVRNWIDTRRRHNARFVNMFKAYNRLSPDNNGGVRR